MSEANGVSAMLGDILFSAQGRAEQNQTCKRKAVGCAVVEIGLRPVWTAKKYPPRLYVKPLIMAVNGPLSGHECSNVVGGCGCVHAEQRAVIDLVFARANVPCPGFLEPRHTILLCKYSPCTHCANLIVACQEITDVVYDVLTEHDTRGIDILRGNILSVTQIRELVSLGLIAEWTHVPA